MTGRSGATNLLAVLDAWTDSIDRGIPVDAVYLDFAKAFDTVSHEKLPNKLEGYGIRGHVTDWVRHFPQGRRQRVNVNGTKSECMKHTGSLSEDITGP